MCNPSLELRRAVERLAALGQTLEVAARAGSAETVLASLSQRRALLEEALALPTNDPQVSSRYLMAALSQLDHQSLSELTEWKRRVASELAAIRRSREALAVLRRPASRGALFDTRS